MGQLTFPLNLYNRAFRIATLLVVNNTAAMLFLATMGTPDVGNTPVPPYTALPIYGWDSTDLAIGSDGNPLRVTDTLSLTYFEDRPALPSIQINQPNYYDKPNPAYITLGTNGVLPITPGTSANIATYTVPVNRKAYLEQVLAMVYRRQAAVTPGTDEVYVAVTLAGYMPQTFAAAVLASGGPESDRCAYSQLGVIGAGGVVAVGYGSGSLGGQLSGIAAVRITEFDA